MIEFRVWHGEDPHDSWVTEGHSSPTTDRAQAEKDYEFWSSRGIAARIEWRAVTGWTTEEYVMRCNCGAKTNQASGHSTTCPRYVA